MNPAVPFHLLQMRSFYCFEEPDFHLICNFCGCIIGTKRYPTLTAQRQPLVGRPIYIGYLFLI